MSKIRPKIARSMSSKRRQKLDIMRAKERQDEEFRQWVDWLQKTGETRPINPIYGD